MCARWSVQPSVIGTRDWNFTPVLATVQLLENLFIFLHQGRLISLLIVMSYHLTLSPVSTLGDVDLVASRENSMLLKSFEKLCYLQEIWPPAH